MEKDLESWLHHQQLNEQFPNAKSLKLPLDDNGMQNLCSPCAIPCTIATSTNGTGSTFGHSSLTNIKPVGLKEPHGWFHCLPRSRQGLIADITLHDGFMAKTKLPDMVFGNGNFGNVTSPATGNGLASKQFLVFDQTGNKTTMMFSSGIGTSIPRPTAWNRQPTYFHNFNDDELKIRSDDLDGDNGSVVGSDMPEDSEEIDALLYSDEEDDYSVDVEETSTGHSPSTMTAYEKRDWAEEEDLDEVASSAGPVKRQKLYESDYQVATVTYTASSIKPNRSLEYEEDAESSCVGCQPMPYNDMGSSTGNKRIRREKIRETVSILQTILPSVQGKDAVTVLDEAINYLKSLKFKAKALGLSEGSEQL